MIQSRDKPSVIVLAVVLTVAVLSVGAFPAAATHDGGDDSGMSDALSPTDDGGITDTVRGLATGAYERAKYKVSTFTSDSPAAEDSRDDALETFNQHSENYVAYLNARDVHNGEVVEVTFEQNDETATMYIVGEFNDSSGEYESADAVIDTDRDVDHEIGLRGMAADNAASELDRFNDEFAEPDDDLTNRYVSEMATKYKGLIDEPFTGGS